MRQRIEPGYSLYLDLVRLLAALIVMMTHATVSGLIALPNEFLDLAPSAVVVFFVLSGYIIEATTDPSAGFNQYLVHRAARIYSVVLPAVLLSVIIAGGFAATAGPEELHSFVRDWMQWWRLPVIFTFQGEDWFAVVEVPWNGPFWSLHYEVFYYALYAVLTFSKGRKRTVAVAAVSLIAGPKILLLMPCWWIGVELARRPTVEFPSRGLAWVVLIMSPLLIGGLAISHLGNWITKHIEAVVPAFVYFDHSRPFITHYMTAAFVAVGFVAARQLRFGPTSLLVRCGKPLAWAAGYTFSIYLLHRPLQHLVSKFYRIEPGGALAALAIQGGILLVIIAIGSVSERRTASWRRMLRRLIARPDIPQNSGQNSGNSGDTGIPGTRQFRHNSEFRGHNTN